MLAIEWISYSERTLFFKIGMNNCNYQPGPSGQFPPWDEPDGNHGSCIHQNKYPVQDDEYSYMYHDSLQAHLTLRYARRES